MFSHHIQILFDKLRFLMQLIKRFCIVMFRKRKGLELLYLDYQDRNLFNNSVVIINYGFKNAIYYKFGSHITTDSKIKLFNLNKIPPEFPLTVYGFFRRQHYILKLRPENILINRTFRAQFSNLNPELVDKVFPKKYSNDFSSGIKRIDIKLPEIASNFKPIELNHNSFNKTDFL